MEKNRNRNTKKSLEASICNPWFGAALYMERAFNDHIGLAIELLYSRFDGSFQLHHACGDMQVNTVTSIDTIGLPVLLVWSWTASIRPDFREDYFHGRIFMGFHPFWSIRGVIKSTLKASRISDESNKYNIPFDKDNPRHKIGLIGGTSFEFTNGLLLEIRIIAPYKLSDERDRKNRPNIKSFHLSTGYNFAKFLT